MAQATLRVQGLNQLVRDFRRLEHRLAGELQRELKVVAEPVAEEVRSRVRRFGPRTVSGVRPRARGSSAFVEQSTRKTTGVRGDFGALQMRTAFIPALRAREAEVVRGIEEMLDRLTSQEGFGRGGIL